MGRHEFTKEDRVLQTGDAEVRNHHAVTFTPLRAGKKAAVQRCLSPRVMEPGSVDKLDLLCCGTAIREPEPLWELGRAL